VKKYLENNVLEEARKRISIVFDNFSKYYISFSGGKDSSVMLHLVMDEAIKRNKKVGVLFIDLEAQYKTTIDHIKEMIEEYKEHIELYWICLPIILRNAVSVYEPRWYCWEDGKEWVRSLPKQAINSNDFFSFFKFGMEFEEFVPEFGKWYSNGEKTACFVGIRTDESLNRYRTIASNKKKCFKEYKWTTKIWESNVYNIYPIYDFRTRDIWIYNQKHKKKYNKLYDLMHQAGLTIHQQRICQPYGDDQRKGLWLYQVIEPETWSKVVARVNGANSGAEFVQYSGSISGQIKINKPEGHTWQTFSDLLLNSMPKKMKEHYEAKIITFLNWWANKGGYYGGIPDESDKKLEAERKVPSWRRICKMLLRNDYWAKGLSMTQTKTGFFYQQYLKRKKTQVKEYLKLRMYRSGYDYKKYMNFIKE